MINVEPTLNDHQVMRFIHNGYITLESVIDPDFNKACDAVHGGHLSDFVLTDEFRRNVLLHPAVAGVVRSLLGKNFLVPTSAHHHLFEAPHRGQTWHSDGLTEYGYGITHLQCYYYPKAVKIEDGPTMILPGSHHRLVDREAIAHYGDILGQLSLTVPAGTVAMTRYGIWHKAGPKLNADRRGMIKFSYYRTAMPKRDWARDSDEIPSYQHQGRHPYVTEVESYRDRRKGELTWNWLCGLAEVEDPIPPVQMFNSGIPLSEIQLQ
ncbi:phytanoyl-CoA dioxygenase family protein [Candidatus Poribacteria bacterium]|nr:phytanoyl-CoA dioxygenase family protein [Candidatus Poribacteria bacterium]